MKLLNIIGFIFLLALSACSKTEDINNPAADISNSGFVQKGPFIIGTNINVQELDNELNSTGRNFQTQISNDIGNFNLSSKSDAKFAEFIATGFYFNEVEGKLSNSSITLRSISEISKPSNINVLTTLQASRIRSLIKSGRKFNEAISQSKKEVLSLFGIDDTNVSNFEDMNIAGKGESNSILLATSSILQQDRSEAQLSELIAKLSIDIADNGIVNQQSLITEIRNSSKYVNASQVIQNLTTRYKQLGLDYAIEDFYCYLDSDGDGDINNQKPYLIFENEPENLTCKFDDTELTLNFRANFNPQIEIIKTGAEDFATVRDIDKSKLVLTIQKNNLESSRSCEIILSSSDKSIVKKLKLTQFSSRVNLSVQLSFHNGIITKNAIPSTSIDISKIDIIGFDNNGNLLFHQIDNNPIIESSVYNFEANIEELEYKNCTLYTIINGVNDYSIFNGNISQFELISTSSIDDKIFISKVTNVHLTRDNNPKNPYYPEINKWKADLARAVAKIAVQLKFDDSIPESKRVVQEITIQGNFYPDTFLFRSPIIYPTSSSKQLNIDDINAYTFLTGGSSLNGIQLELANRVIVVGFSNSIIVSPGHIHNITLNIGLKDIILGKWETSDEDITTEVE